MTNHERNSGIFRQEVYEAKKSDWLGRILLIQPISFPVLTTTFVLITCLLVIYLFAGEYTRKERVRGYLAPDKGVISVIPTQSGVYSRVLVGNGDLVEFGSAIAIVSAQAINTSGESVNTLLLKELNVEKGIIESRIDLERQRFASEKHKLSDAITGINAELDQLLEQKLLQQSRVTLERQIVTSQ